MPFAISTACESTESCVSAWLGSTLMLLDPLWGSSYPARLAKRSSTSSLLSSPLEAPFLSKSLRQAFRFPCEYGNDQSRSSKGCTAGKASPAVQCPLEERL